MNQDDASMDILLSQRFAPEQGGSIRWMLELCRHWPRPMHVITHDYGQADDAETMSLFQDRPDIQIHRGDILLDNWGIDRPGRLLRYLRMAGMVRRVIRGGRAPQGSAHVGNAATAGDTTGGDLESDSQLLQSLAGPSAGDRSRGSGGRFRGSGDEVRVHCTHAVPEVVSLLPLKWKMGRRLRIFCYAHGEEITACQASRQLAWLYRKAAGASERLLANSRFTENLLAGLVDPERVVLMNPGVNLAEFAGAAELGKAWRAGNGLEGRRLVLTLGRLDPRKNQAAILRAVAALASDMPDLHYVVAGAGPEESHLRELATNLGIAARVSFLGAVGGEERIALFGACDVFAMPAIRSGTDVEGFGLVFLEAGACGRPSIAGCEGGQPDAVADGVAGLVVDGTDDQAVKQAMERLLSDEELRASMGEAARRRAEQADWSRVVQRTWELVEKR